MSQSPPLPIKAQPSSFLQLLPAKAYIPLETAKATTELDSAMVDAHPRDPALPTAEEIKAAMDTKRRSSSTSTLASIGSSDGSKKTFLPLAPMALADEE